MAGVIRCLVTWREAEYERVQAPCSWDVQLLAATGRHEHGAHSRGHGPAAPPRSLRRPRPDRDRHGQEPGQAAPPVPELFVLPARPVVPAAPRRRAASGGGRVHRTGEAVGVFGRSDPPHVLARGPARGRRLHALADRVRPAVLPVDGSRDQAVAAGRLPLAGAQPALAAAPVAVRQQDEGRWRGRRAAAGGGQVPVRVPLHENAVVVTAFRPTRGRG